MPLEFLCLETGTTPIRFLILCRRILYLQNILKRADHELIKRVYKAQVEDPTPGDFAELVRNDFAMINEQLDESKIENMNKQSYKEFIKTKVKVAAFNFLKKLQEKHSKIKHIVYKKLETQKYMLSPLFSDEEVNLLHSLRSRSIDCKANYSNMYKDDDMMCILCKTECCNQQHIMQCSVLIDKFKTDEIAKHKVMYEHIFDEDVHKQKVVTSLFKNLLEIRKQKTQDLLEKQNPSTTSEELRRSIDLQPCIVYSSFGK